MQLPPVALADWRAKVEQELAGKSFEKVLVQQTSEGIAVQPLYTELPATLPPRDPGAQPFRICVRAGPAPLLEIEDGADALWLSKITPELREKNVFFVLESRELPPASLLPRVAFCHDLSATRGGEEQVFGEVARFAKEHEQAANLIPISGVPFHDSGADAADELAGVLWVGARALRRLMEAGLPADRAARQLWVQLAAGRDTFLELCKFRALRTVWRKLLTAVGAPDAPRTLVHAVCSDLTLTQRDPWVNLLRVTTQMFAAIVGGADLVTPNEFDRVLTDCEPSAQARRMARNTGLVLREESMLGKVQDPAGGSYAFETMTDQLARSAWQRFQVIARDGGFPDAFVRTAETGKRIAQTGQDRAWSIARRKIPILGVSEFANLDEKLPQPARAVGFELPRDSAAFEKLRLRADETKPEALLITLGPFAESRARAGFAASFLAAGGIRSRESAANERAAIACLCGTDERYAAEAVERVRALKAAGCKRVLIAGRPGELEKPLREAGADGFIHVGCDAVAILSELLS
jgi:methylmalonyl-CoA mutase